MGAEKITYIVPVYNAGADIERCIESILSQSSDSCESIFIDDGSQDDSLERLKRHASAHPDKIRVISQENAGVAKTRDRGVREAVTKYVAFIDQDDLIDPDYTETLLAAVVESGADMVVSGFRRADDERIYYETRYRDDGGLSKYLAETCWAKVFDRAFLVDNDIRFLSTSIGEDIFFNCSVCLNTDKIAFIDYVGYTWYLNPKSVSSTAQRGLKEGCDLLVLAEALDRLYADSPAKDDIFRYFVFRDVTVLFLLSGQKASPERFKAECQRYYRWLDAHGYQLSIPFYDRRISSEKLYRRLYISVFNRLRRMHLVGLFARVFCQGRAE